MGYGEWCGGYGGVVVYKKCIDVESDIIPAVAEDPIARKFTTYSYTNYY